MAVSPESNEVFLREVDDELRRERLTRFFTRWGFLVIGGVVLVLALFGGYLYWQHHRSVVAGRQGEQLQAAFDSLGADNPAAAAAPLRQLSNGGNDGYRTLARFAEGDILLNKHDLKGAAAKFATIANDQSVGAPFRDLALVRQTAAEFDTLAPSAVIERLRPLAVAHNPWFGSAGELVAIAYVDSGRRDLAGRMFAAMAADPGVPESIRQRAVQMAGSMGADVPAQIKDMKHAMTKHFRTPLAIAVVIALSSCGIFKGHVKRTPTIGNRIPILVSENGVAVDPTIANVPVTVPAAETNDSWTQPGGDAAKTMGNLTLAAAPARIWTTEIDGGSTRELLGATPVVADNKLFVSDVDATVHAFAADTGAALWTKSITEGKVNQAARFGGGVSYDDGKLYATDGLGDVVAMNAADGTILWRAKPGGPLRGSPSVALGSIYVLTQDNQIFALNEADGKVLWAQAGTIESQGVFGVAAPAVANGSVVAGFSSGELNAYRYENGRILWQDALSRTSISTSVSSLSDIDADPVVDDGRVYAVGQGGRMVALELSTGQRLWEQNFAGISTPAVGGQWIFVVTDDARLVCLDRASGKARWIAQLQRFRNAKKKSGAITWFGPVIAGSRLVLTNSEGQIVYTDPTDGHVVTTVETKQAFALPPIVANATLYVIDHRGRITAFR